MNLQRKLIVVALATAMPWISAQAQSTADLQKEIELLKSQLKSLQDRIEAVANKPAAPAAGAVDPEEFNRIKIKVESAEDNTIASGFANLKISGMIDPTFVYNKRQNQAGFVFLNNFYDQSGIGGTKDVYSYDNSYFGQAMLDIQKETEGGSKWRLTLAPHKSASSGFNLGSIVHEASVSIPLSGPATRLIAGQVPDWSGYEFIWSHQQPLISHNLLFDFTIPSYYSGVGMEMTRGKWISKFMVGNINESRKGNGAKSPGVTYRVDYSKGEFSGFGFAGSHSFSSKNAGGKYNLFEVDGYFTRGDWVLQGQVGIGNQKNAAFGGGDAKWSGLSGLAGYKATPRLQFTARADFINNKKNGGGVFGSNALFGATGDDRNGFGPAWEDDGSGTNTWVQNDLTKGVNRTALSLGASYLFNQNTTFKAEYRIDRASGAVFLDDKTQGYKKSNSMIGLSAVVSF
ncbi:MAG: DUF3138 family protein [Burkholderiales bacterium]|nr:MAG: DUF3138 family protein [Burkholderiales bacterium]